MPEQPPLDFMHEYILKVLGDAGMADLTPDQQADYVPQFVAEAEYRLGAALLPHLSEAGATQYAQLFQSGETTSQQWADFWRAQVPEFEQIIGKALADFAVEMKKAIE